MRYQVHIDREGDTWNIRVPELDLRTETVTPRAIPQLARDLIANHLGVDRDSFEIDALPPGSTGDVARANVRRGRNPDIR